MVEARRAGSLLRILGVGFGLAVIVGSTIGVGILRTPGVVARHLGSPGLILTVWVLGGAYTLLGSVCLTELGVMLPQAGGYYVYARRAFGDAVGFAVGWADWLTYCSVLGYVSIAIGEFAVALAPGAGLYAPAVALATLLSFAALQWYGLRLSARVQEGTSLLKFLAFMALAVTALLAPRAAASDPAEMSSTGFFPLVLALQSVVVTYGGWQSALYFAEEDRDPARNLPRSMIGGVALVLLVYLLLNAAFLHVLPMATLQKSSLPAAEAAEALVGPGGAMAITALSLLSLLPLVNAVLLLTTRIVFAMGRDGLLFAKAGHINEGGTPEAALLVTTGAAAALILTGTFEKLIALAAFLLAANYCACCLALFVLRWREPDTPRPFRAWGYPWSAIVVLVGALLFLGGVVIGDAQNSLAALALVAIGFPVRLLLQRSRR